MCECWVAVGSDVVLIILRQSLIIDRQHLSYDGCVEIRELFCVVLCILKPCTVISTLRWAVITVLWIGFCHTGPISLCVDCFICVHLYILCVIVLYCKIVIVLWARRDRPDGIEAYCLGPIFLQCFDCWLGYLTGNKPSPIWPIMCLVGH